MTTLLAQGGPVLVAIFALSLCGWTVLLWSALRLYDENHRGRRLGERVLGQLARGQYQAALAECRDREEVVPRLLRFVLSTRPSSERSWQQHVLPIVHAETRRLNQPVQFLAACTAVLPLLGLLGTVLGMMASFEVIVARGIQRPDAFADGISQALLTTQAGLLTSLPLLFATRWLAGRSNWCREQAELYAKRADTWRHSRED